MKCNDIFCIIKVYIYLIVCNIVCNLLEEDRMKREWTLTGLNQEMKKDLLKCNTDFEKAMCKTVCKKEIKEKAFEIQKHRKLTPGEISVLLNI